MLVVKNNQKRIGFSVSKKVGNAVVRNRTKRRLRECVRPLLPEMKNGLYVFVARPCAAECTFEELKQDVLFLLKKTNGLKAVDKEERK